MRRRKKMWVPPISKWTRARQPGYCAAYDFQLFYFLSRQKCKNRLNKLAGAKANSWKKKKGDAHASGWHPISKELHREGIEPANRRRHGPPISIWDRTGEPWLVLSSNPCGFWGTRPFPLKSHKSKITILYLESFAKNTERSASPQQVLWIRRVSVHKNIGHIVHIDLKSVHFTFRRMEIGSPHNRPYPIWVSMR